MGGGVLLAAVVSLSLPQVRTVLQQSFTHMPQPSTAIYFTSSPQINGTVLDVPVTVKGINTGVSTYNLKVWTVNAAGKIDSTTNAKVGTAGGVSASVVALPIAADASEVWVSLDGTAQTLHFQIANS